MLELIVLGKIPGTQLQLTFSQVSCLALVLLAVALTRIEVRKTRLLLIRFMSNRQLNRLIRQYQA